MRTKGAANRVRYHRDIKTDVLNDLVKFRCSDVFKALLQDFRNSQSSFTANRSEGAFIRKAILKTMLREGTLKPALLQRIQDELEKIV